MAFPAGMAAALGTATDAEAPALFAQKRDLE